MILKADRESCELKNGPVGCLEGETPNSRSRTNTAAETSRYSGFRPSMCKSIAEGGTGFLDFYKNALTGRLDDFMEYCREVEGYNTASADDGGGGTARSDPAGMPDADKSGTWQCQLANGNGPVLGVYGMINSPEVIASTCKKVGNHGVGNW